jgi:hypothetical protein
MLLLGILLLTKDLLSKPREAPEAERVLAVQAAMPFQLLIPAYLPEVFDRERVEILTDQRGPNGEEMIRLVYPMRGGYSLTLSEWLPAAQDSNAKRCLCACTNRKQCNMLGMELGVGAVRVKVEYSAPNLLPYEELQLVLETLGPAANRQVYSSIQDVPLSVSMPPAVQVPLGADGVQEVTLVVSPTGYTPVHFSVKKDVPVRLIFRQLGYVGCGNELIFQWGKRDTATLILASEADKQSLEFTPGEAGEFQLHCPHFIYRGLMTVTE